MNGTRFSKAKLSRALAVRINEIESRRHFDPSNGYAQVQGKGEEVNRDYGRWRALRDVAIEFNLEIE